MTTTLRQFAKALGRRELHHATSTNSLADFLVDAEAALRLPRVCLAVVFAEKEAGR